MLVDAEVIGRVTIPRGALPVAPTLPKPEATSSGGVASAKEKTPLEPTDWNGHVALGVSNTSGNTETFLATLDALLQKDWTHDHLEFRAHAAYGTAEGDETVNNQSLGAWWRHYYDENLYSYASLEFQRDVLADLDLRVLANVGVGYRAWIGDDPKKQSLDFEGGIGYRYESFSGTEGDRHDATVRGALIYKDIFFDDVEFSQLLEVFFPLTDPGSWLGRSETVASIPLSESWFFRAALRLEYAARPASGREPLDTFTSVGLEYRF